MRGLAKVKSRHRARVRMIWFGTRLECVESSSRASGAYQDGTREFAGRRPRVTERLLGVAERLARSWEDEANVWLQGQKSAPDEINDRPASSLCEGNMSLSLPSKCLSLADVEDLARVRWHRLPSRILFRCWVSDSGRLSKLTEILKATRFLLRRLSHPGVLK
ncbi:hypothetical protein BHM03_00058139 [Ensete ventricosum]|nr:hypothetical protein BHM03_00058139 [Ensete ventricosum]